MKHYLNISTPRFYQKRKGNLSVYIGNAMTGSRHREMVDFNLKIASCNELFKNNCNAYFIRYSNVVDDPLSVYSDLTFTLHNINRRSIYRNRICSYRLFNVNQFRNSYRVTYNVACWGMEYAIDLTCRLVLVEGFTQPTTLYVAFREPRTSLLKKRFKDYYVRFREASQSSRKEIKTTIDAPYAWSITCSSHNLHFVTLLLFDLFNDQLDNVVFQTRYRQIELSSIPNIDDEDYFNKIHPFSKLRFFQAYGRALSLVSIYNSNK